MDETDTFPRSMNRPDDTYQVRGPGPGGVRIGAVIAVALAVAFLVWLLFIREDDDETTGTGTDAAAQVEALGPVEADRNDIAELAQEAGQPVYWAGQIEGTTIELTRTTDGNVYVRYLDEGADVGDSDPFLTVSTYPFEDAFNALGVVAERPGSSTETLDDGALVVAQGGDSATSAYYAQPGEDVQVEVFDPDPGEALEVATSGDIQPVE